jgi:aryl-alcohol dehydrogenase-like predicted oxidoreductase
VQPRRLGNSDLMVSPIGLGTSTWGTSTDPDDAAAQLGTYLDVGGNFVDTADVYGAGRAEEIIGRILDDGLSRDTIVLATKAGGVIVGGKPSANGSCSHLLAALHASLRRLRTDHVDLWQLHAWDQRVPLEETLSAVDKAITRARSGTLGYATMRAGRRRPRPPCRPRRTADCWPPRRSSTPCSNGASSGKWYRRPKVTASAFFHGRRWAAVC